MTAIPLPASDEPTAMERRRLNAYLWLLASAFVLGMSMPLEGESLIRDILLYGGAVTMALLLTGWMIADILVRHPGRPTREMVWRCLFWIATVALVPYCGFVLYFVCSRGWKGLVMFVAFVLGYSVPAWLGAGVSFVIQNRDILFR